jgi:hypothetical protein
LALYIVAGAVHLGDFLALGGDALLNHFDFGHSDLGLELAFGGVDFFALEGEFVFVAAHAVFHALEGFEEAAESAFVALGDGAFVDGGAEFALFGFFESPVEAFPDLVAVFVAHARVAVAALHLLEFVEDGVQFGAADGDAGFDVVEGFVEFFGGVLRGRHEFGLHAGAHFFEVVEEAIDVVAQVVGVLAVEVALAALALHFVPEGFEAVPEFVVVGAELFDFFFELGQLLLVGGVEFGGL